MRNQSVYGLSAGVACVTLTLGCARGGPAAPAAVAEPQPPASEETAATTPTPTPTSPVEAATGLRFVVEATEAELFVDGQSRGSVAALDENNGVLVLEPGVYAISFKRPGYSTWRAEISVEEGVQTIKVVMKKAP